MHEDAQYIKSQSQSKLLNVVLSHSYRIVSFLLVNFSTSMEASTPLMSTHSFVSIPASQSFLTSQMITLSRSYKHGNISSRKNSIITTPNTLTTQTVMLQNSETVIPRRNTGIYRSSSYIKIIELFFDVLVHDQFCTNGAFLLMQ